MSLKPNAFFTHLRCRVGILAGSFNPAHKGHVALSLESIKQLKLDQVWWIVTRKNPLKTNEDLLPFNIRVSKAIDLCAPHRKIQVTDLEETFHTTYSFKTVDCLLSCFPNVKFVWIIGADNLLSFHRWKQSEQIFARIPIAVLARNYSIHKATRSKTAIKYRKSRISSGQCVNLLLRPPPIWTFCSWKEQHISGTEIRKSWKNSNF